MISEGVVWFGFDEGTGEFNGEYSTVKPHDTRGMIPFVRASALSSQSLSLSEAREEIERLKGLVAGIRETDTTYVIWSNEHRAWWGPDRRGYCSRLDDAGRYDRESALGVCIGARGGRRYNDNPSEVMVLFEDACLFWPDDKPEWREARARWNAPLEEPPHD